MLLILFEDLVAFPKFLNPNHFQFHVKIEFLEEGGPKMQCCGGITNPFFTINPFQKDCCENGTTAPKGKCPIIEPTIYPETTQTTEGYNEATTVSVTN